MGDVIEFYKRGDQPPNEPKQSAIGRICEEIMKPLPFSPSEEIGTGDLFLGHLWKRGYKVVQITDADLNPTPEPR